LLDADAGDDLVIACDFKELLVEYVVLVAIDEGGDVPYDSEDIELIPLDGVIGQEDVVQFEVEEVVAHGAHHLVGLHVVHVQDVQVVEAAVEGLADLEAQVHHCVEDAHFLELDHAHQVLQLAHPRTHSFQLLDQHGAGRHSQEVLQVALQGNHIILLERSDK
jgi:hypothetical protein